MSKKALLFVNRNARQGKSSLAQAIQELHALDFEVLPLPIQDCEKLSDLIVQYRNEVDLVIIGGGDGTLNAIVDSLVEAKLPLGILPLGTANDLARTLNLPQTISEACQTIAAGFIQPIDLGWVNGKHFFNVASMGLSVKMTQQLSSDVKQKWGIFAYALTALKVMRQMRSFPAEIRMNGETIRVKTLQIAIGNGRYYGGGMAVATDAAIDDQQLDLYSLEIQHWWQAFPLLLTFRQGQHVALPWVRHLRGQAIEVCTPRPHDINTDGELTTKTPATFRVIPKALSVIVPRPEIGDGDAIAPGNQMSSTRHSSY